MIWAPPPLHRSAATRVHPQPSSTRVLSLLPPLSSGYVEQFDTLLESLTVQEMLMYTAELKRPVDEPREEKQAAVEELIDVLGLAACRDVKIGK